MHSSSLNTKFGSISIVTILSYVPSITVFEHAVQAVNKSRNHYTSKGNKIRRNVTNFLCHAHSITVNSLDNDLLDTHGFNDNTQTL